MSTAITIAISGIAIELVAAITTLLDSIATAMLIVAVTAAVIAIATVQVFPSLGSP